MKIHREGYLIIIIALTILTLLEITNLWLYGQHGLQWIFVLFSLVVIAISILILRFFRIPNIQFQGKDNEIISPADGKVVVIEEIDELEYFHDRRIQISIFMSIYDVHANFNPVSGTVKHVKYHEGKFLVARNPKSSTDNERTSIVVEHANGKSILFKQIAGAVARRICYYVEEGDKVKAGEEYGFIKFGSRIDLILPLDTKINVKIGDKVKGRITKIAEW